MKRRQSERTNVVGWERMRLMGMKGFILRYGVLAWGVPSGVLFGLCFGWISGASSTSFGLICGLSLLMFPIGGIAFGWSMWKLSEWNYKRIIRQASGDAGIS